MRQYQYKHGDRPLDGYTIERAAGRGGFGEVYYAISDAGKEVAIKTIQNYAHIELRGISQCMNLKSPHLVSIFDVKYNDKDEPFVVMEYVSGPSLGDIIKESGSGIGTQKAAFFLREIAKGISYLHDCGIVHRDLKPSNVFYENGQVKIGDYGLSKAINATQHSGQTITVGTVHYMAPEIGEGKYDRSIDIYALGIMLYEMLTGQVPYFGASPAEILMKHLSAEPDLTGIDATFARVIHKAMAKDPKERYKTVQEMVEDVFGSEHIRNSVSQFSSESLSMVAAQVAKKIKPITPPSGNDTRQQTQQVRSAQAAGYQKVRGADALTDKQRTVLAIIAAAVIILGGGLFNVNRIGASGIFLLILIPVIAKLILHARFNWFANLEDEGPWIRRLSTGGVGAAALVLIGVMTRQSAETWGVLAVMFFLVDWWKLSSPTRFWRLDLGKTIGFALLTFILGAVFTKTESGVFMGSFVMAGVMLMVQIWSKYNMSDASVAAFKNRQQPKAAAAPPPPSPPKPTNRVVSGNVSEHSRTTAMILCACMFVGVNGLHRFYVGKIGTGILWFLTGGLFGIGQLIDIIVIVSGGFRDKEGGVLENWDGGLNNATPPGRINNQHPAVQPAANKQPASIKQPAQQAVDAATTSYSQTGSGPIVVQLPRERIDIASATCSVLGGLFILLMLIAGLMAALHIPSIVKASAPGWEGVADLDLMFKGSNWPAMFESIFWIISLAFGFAAVIFKAFGRRVAGAWHMIRGVVSIAGIMGSIAVLSETSRRFGSGGSASNPGQVIERLVKALNSEETVLAIIIFIASMVLLAWPAKKNQPKYIAVDNSNGGLN